MTIREELEKMASGWETLAPGRPNRERLTLTHGREFTPAPLPAHVERGLPKFCFWNAQRLAGRSRGKLRYVEGFGLRPMLGFPFHHAWCVDADGRVVDPTWDNPEVCEYFGVPFDMATVRKRRTKYDLSVLHTLLTERGEDR